MNRCGVFVKSKWISKSSYETKRPGSGVILPSWNMTPTAPQTAVRAVVIAS
jgi:hypothetical protein